MFFNVNLSFTHPPPEIFVHHAPPQFQIPRNNPALDPLNQTSRHMGKVVQAIERAIELVKPKNINLIIIIR